MVINITALVYSSWAFFWSFWPNSYTVTAVNMNYAVVLFVGFITVSMIIYLWHSRHIYEGPVAKVQKC